MVREAVAALRADGLVVTRQGVGAFVPENARPPLRIAFDRLSPLRAVLEVMELRTGIEIEAAGLFGSYSRALGWREGKPDGSDKDPTFRIRATPR